jgi:hypothetical protein
MLQRTSARIQAQQQAWERTQEVRQQQWKAQQERQALDAERHLTDAEKQLHEQVQQLRSEWPVLEKANRDHAEKLQQQFDSAIRQIHQEYEFARLSRIEDTPLPPNSKDEHSKLATNRQAPDLRGTDLSKRDLSSRYLSHANLRDAKLAQTNLFMADLSSALLTNANLAGANLSAANLSHADLQNANLEGANFLVTDLYNAILIGADLRRSHNLTSEQIRTAIYNETTRFDPEVAQALQPASPSQTVTANAENTPSTENEQKFINPLDEPIVEEQKNSQIDTPYSQEKAVQEDIHAEPPCSAENGLLNSKITNPPEEMAENA